MWTSAVWGDGPAAAALRAPARPAGGRFADAVSCACVVRIEKRVGVVKVLNCAVHARGVLKRFGRRQHGSQRPHTFKKTIFWVIDHLECGSKRRKYKI